MIYFCIFSFSEIAAWLAENGPVSVALNAFAMQVGGFFKKLNHSSKQQEAKQLSRCAVFIFKRMNSFCFLCFLEVLEEVYSVVKIREGYQ